MARMSNIGTADRMEGFFASDKLLNGHALRNIPFCLVVALKTSTEAGADLVLILLRS